MLKVREATVAELNIIMDIYESARDFMAATGNPNQWRRTNPTEEQIREDIQKGICHVIYAEDTIYGVFALCQGADPTYGYIEDGRWKNEEAYVTIHRIASSRKEKGIFHAAMEYCKKFADNIRIDTHRDNKVMQNILAQKGFEACGIIYLQNKEPRIAYQWCGLEENGEKAGSSDQ